MANTIYSIRTGKKAATVYYNINLSATKRLTGKTNVKVNPKYWDDGKRMQFNDDGSPKLDANRNPIYKKTEPAQIDLNKARALRLYKEEAQPKEEALKKFADFVTTCLTNMDQSLNPEDKAKNLRFKIDDELGRINTSYSKKVIIPLKNYFEIHKDKLRNIDKSEDTLYLYDRLYDLLTEFTESQTPKIPLEYDNITEPFYLDFIKYNQSKGRSNGYLKLITQKLNSIMRGSLKYHGNADYTDFDITSPKTFDIYLTADDLNKLKAVELDDIKDRAVRDYFLLLCYTGARVTDVLGKTKNKELIWQGWHSGMIEDIDGVDKLVYQMQKNGKVHTIELNPSWWVDNITNHHIKEIISNWGILGKSEYGFPNERNNINISAYQLNARIQKIAKKAGLNDSIKGMRKGKKVSRQKSAWIRSHCGKRTCSTLAFVDAKLPVWWIQTNITMHSTPKITEDYIKADDPKIESIMKKRKNKSNQPVLNIAKGRDAG